jgi:hypothetical protein
VALHADWKTACTRASWELGERDRVLRSWYGEILPVPLTFPDSSRLRSAESYEWLAYAFPDPDPTSFSSGVEVVGVFGFPARLDAPLVMGFAARADAGQALAAAETEATQLLAFLWGEVTGDLPSGLGPTAAHHIDHFQWRPKHRELRAWLGGAHRMHARPTGFRGETRIGFVDLTPDWLGGGLRVAKAVCPTATPLIFGDSPLGRHLPRELRAHPIG